MRVVCRAEGYTELHDLNQVVLSNNNLTELTNMTFAALSNSTLRKLEISRSDIRYVAIVSRVPSDYKQSLTCALFQEKKMWACALLLFFGSILATIVCRRFSKDMLCNQRLLKI
jgi:hypothetical protein